MFLKRIPVELIGNFTFKSYTGTGAGEGFEDGLGAGEGFEDGLGAGAGFEDGLGGGFEDGLGGGFEDLAAGARGIYEVVILPSIALN